jgi:ABC-2 type transport system ATP-binding protein
MIPLEIKNLSKKFGTFSAVDDISFELKENRVMGFLGPNGAGKTTTLRIIAGLSKPTSGEIIICGEKVSFGNSRTNQLFGYLPEQPAFYNWMTGEEYLKFVADSFGIEKQKAKDRINELLKLTDLKEFGKKRISTYSNGMKQRLGIAQALINEPKLLIMDEPVSALDPIGRREVLATIEKLKKSVSIIFSTHILSDVDRICDDVAILNKGKLITLSPLSKLKEKAGKPILEIEFASSPSNILDELKKEAWLDRLESSGNHLKIWLKTSSSTNKNTPLRFFAKSDIEILKYGLIIPEIEDLFVELIEKGETK